MKTTKVITITTAILFMVIGSVKGQDPVIFNDPALEAVVREALGIPTDPIMPADMLNLTNLHAGGRGIADITGIEYAINLTTLNLGKNNNITDISLLAGLTTLEQLILIGNQISDITPLTGLSNLSRLSLSNNQINDITPLAQLTNLNFLDVGENSFTNIDPLLELTKLWHLSLDSSAIKDISWLPELTGLTELFLSSNPQITDFSVVSSMPNLTKLAIARNQITDISFLTSLTQLQYLSLDYNSITDISVLSGLPDLVFVDLSYNLITNIAPLSGMVGLTGLRLSGNPQISDFNWIGGLSNLTSLELKWNKISDISFMTGLTDLGILRLDGNKISDVYPLTELYQLYILDLRTNPLNFDSCTVYIPQIITNNPGITLFQNSCPDPGSLLVNGGFESGAMSPWKRYANPPVVIKTGVVQELTGASFPEDPIEGNYCLEVDVSDTSENFWDAGVLYDGLAYQAGKKYTLSAFLKCKEGSLQINFKTELSMDPWTGYEQQFTMTDEWAEYSFTTPVFFSEVSPAQVTFHVGFADGEFWMDDVRLTEEDAPPDVVYFPDQNLKQAVIDALAGIGIYTTDPTESQMANLTQLYAGGRGIVDLTGIEHAVNLILLAINDNQISNIGLLSGLINLTYLDLSKNSIIDISPLLGLVNLESVSLRDNQIEVIPALPVFTKMTSLDLSNNNIIDISVLAGLTNLTYLNLEKNQISDISPLSGVTNLEILILGGNSISDISSLSNITSLTNLILGRNQISDLFPLSDLVNLTELNLAHNQITNISAISGLSSLINLNLSKNQISDISALSGLSCLVNLILDRNQISDISALSGLTNLTGDLILHGNQISDLSPLSGLINLTKLDLMKNRIISDISPLSELKNCESLILRCNQITDISPLTGLTNLTDLELDDNPLSWESYCTWLLNIQANNPDLTILKVDPNPYNCNVSPEETPVGTSVPVTPEDNTNPGTSPVTLTFEEVIESGGTSLVTSETGSTPPSGFQLGDPPTYYDITTTASFSGLIVICVDYSGISYSGPEELLKLYHYEGDSWVDCTTFVDTENNINYMW
ncbi:MAG: leucine-rich repeat domain-containing protein [Candidatus Thorarchaeota archaeon]